MNDFFAVVYEILFYSETFSNDMYQNGNYAITGITFILICVFFLFMYYKIIDHPKFANPVSWIILNLVVAIINFGVIYSISYAAISSLYNSNGNEVPYFSPFISFAFVNAGLSIIIFSFLSFLIRLLSTNTRYIPFGKF